MMVSSIDWETTMSKTEKAFDIIAIAVGLILGIAMIGQAAYKLYNGVDGTAAFFYLAHIVMILGGISVVILSPISRLRMIGAYTLTLGISRFFMRCNDISATDDPRLIFVELLFMALAFNMVRIGTYYARGKVVSQLSMTITASILLSTDILIIVIDQYAEELLSFMPFGVDSNFYILNALMYAALIGLLDTKIVRENTEMFKHAQVLDRMRSSYAIEKESYITEDAARCLLDRSGPLWKEINDNTVQSEMAFIITQDEYESAVTVQIWKGKDPLYVTVVNESDSIFNANRFRIDELRESDGILYGYGKDGTRFKVIIKKEEDAE